MCKKTKPEEFVGGATHTRKAGWRGSVVDGKRAVGG